MYQITFQFENGGKPVIVDAAPNTSLLDVAKAANVAIDAPCNGNGSCGKCQVKILEGTVDSTPTHHISAGWRLSCASKPTSDVVVQVPDIASAYQSRMKTADLSTGEEVATFNKLQEDIREAGVDISCDFVSAVLELSEPTLDDTMPDTERLALAAQDAFDGCTEVKLTYHTVKKLAKTLRDANFKVQIAGTLDMGVLTVMDVTGKLDAPMIGCAIDIGTTTVTGVLLNLETGEVVAKASSGNGQIRYGADVINRIIEQSKPGGVKRLQDAILKETLVPLTAVMCKSAGITADRILRAAVASNTTMNHLLLGVDADPVRMEPYIPTFFQWRGMVAKDLGFVANPDAEVLVAPNIGSYVVGDITAGTFASLIWNKDEFSLFIDLGTNGELVFGNRDFMMSCACSAGPAFEGGDISCGMRATDGAVEAVSIDKDTMEPKLTIVGDEGQKPVGICGSGIIDVIAELYRTSIISSKGKFVREGGTMSMAWAAIFSRNPARARPAAKFRSPRSTSTRSSAQRAPSSRPSTSCCLVLIWTFRFSSTSMLRAASARASTWKTPCASACCNTSLAGAYAMVRSENANQKVDEIASNMTYMELSTNPRYMDEFVAACFLPHTNRELFPSSVQE